MRADGSNEENKIEYIRRVVDYKLRGAFTRPLKVFLNAFHALIPVRAFGRKYTWEELEIPFDIEGLQKHTEYVCSQEMRIRSLHHTLAFCNVANLLEDVEQNILKLDILWCTSIFVRPFRVYRMYPARYRSHNLLVHRGNFVQTNKSLKPHKHRARVFFRFSTPCNLTYLPPTVKHHG